MRNLEFLARVFQDVEIPTCVNDFCAGVSLALSQLIIAGINIYYVPLYVRILFVLTVCRPSMLYSNKVYIT